MLRAALIGPALLLLLAHNVAADLCTLAPEIQCGGHSLTPTIPAVSTAAACCAHCKATANCTAWTWNNPERGGNSLCYAKASCPSPFSYPSVISGGAVPAVQPTPGLR